MHKTVPETATPAQKITIKYIHIHENRKKEVFNKCIKKQKERMKKIEEEREKKKKSDKRRRRKRVREEEEE